ncbi:winged helix-turn-helix domain-containing protein [Halosimplex aquaticum]|uniref:Winged helix-turn-helix domain-containing protein n=1 Tax=Halosimplex aquaticum TaxID=3026162 RepID=A0ABD5Y092_9EURY|nr:helix-turn-helix domain-containing protein [Halosimplex aquaticum]
MSDESDGRADPGEVFDAVANETRFDILRAVWDLTTAAGGGSASFARIREEAGVRDSGQFNYHLQELIPRFVQKGDDGYTVTHAGSRFVGAVVSGVYTDDETAVESQPVGACPNCGGTIEAGYETEQMQIECADCEVMVSNMAAPPILAANRDPEELPAVYSRYLLTEVERINRGFCPNCSGRIDTAAERPGGDAFEGFEEYLDVVHECRECGAVSHSTVGAAVVGHPAVVSLFHDAGVDVRETPVWELDPLFDTPGELVGEDPLRVEATVEVGGEALDLLLGENLDVIEYERRTVAGDGE